MKIQSLGHVVLKVRDRAKAEAFYNGILGLPVAVRSESLNMTFFTLGGTHHDFAIAEVGKDAPGTAREAVGLSHVAFKIGDDIESLKRAKAELEPRASRTARPTRRLEVALLRRSRRQPHRALCRSVRRLEKRSRPSPPTSR